MSLLSVAFLGLLLMGSPTAKAATPNCEFIVYESNPKKPALESKTTSIDAGPVDLLGFRFVAQTVKQEPGESSTAPVMLRVSNGGLAASTVMKSRTANVQLKDEAGRKAVARCMR